MNVKNIVSETKIGADNVWQLNRVDDILDRYALEFIYLYI